MLRLLLSILICYLTLTGTLQAHRREYTLRFSYASNVTGMVLINGQIPGPTLHGDVNDIFIVHVENDLDSNDTLAVHFHGLHFVGTPQMDGSPYVSQAPIPQGRNFTYVFRAYPAGTYFYHSHAGLQAMTAFGASIIHDSQNQYKALESPSGPLLFSDQYFGANRWTLEEGLVGSPFHWTGEPTHLLINGKQIFHMALQPKRTYLLRLIGATILSTFVFGIDQHPMTVVEVDGTPVKTKASVDSIEIGSGQRYAVLIHTKDQKTGAFLMRAEIRWRKMPANSSAVGVLTYGEHSTIPANFTALPQPVLANETQLLQYAWNNPYESLYSSDRIPQGKPNREYFMLSHQELTMNGSEIRWFINNGSLTMDKLSAFPEGVLFEYYNGNSISSISADSYTIKQGEIVDFIFQNTAGLNGGCESHPFHMHGHKFWVHSYGTGSYNQATPSSTVIVKNPVFRDSFLLYASNYANFVANRSSSNHGNPCGWARVRVVADNPGFWLFHCHIGAHALMGMNFLVQESIDQISILYYPQH